MKLKLKPQSSVLLLRVKLKLLDPTLKVSCLPVMAIAPPLLLLVHFKRPFLLFFSLIAPFILFPLFPALSMYALSFTDAILQEGHETAGGICSG